LAYSLESQFQPVDDPSVPARYSDEWGSGVIRVCFRKWIDINQSVGGSRDHEGIQAWQTTGSERCTEVSWDIYVSAL
jgi:hypothetical protein